MPGYAYGTSFRPPRRSLIALPDGSSDIVVATATDVTIPFRLADDGGALLSETATVGELTVNESGFLTVVGSMSFVASSSVLTTVALEINGSPITVALASGETSIQAVRNFSGGGGTGVLSLLMAVQATKDDVLRWRISHDGGGTVNFTPIDGGGFWIAGGFSQ